MDARYLSEVRRRRAHHEANPPPFAQHDFVCYKRAGIFVEGAVGEVVSDRVTNEMLWLGANMTVRWHFPDGTRVESHENSGALRAMRMSIQPRQECNWTQVSGWIFRSWGGPRALDDQLWQGCVYILGTDEVARPAG